MSDLWARQRVCVLRLTAVLAREIYTSCGNVRAASEGEQILLDGPGSLLVRTPATQIIDQGCSFIGKQCLCALTSRSGRHQSQREL